MDFKKILFNFVIVCSLVTTLNGSSGRGLIPQQEFDLMEKYGLSRVQAKNYLDLEYAAFQGSSKTSKTILNRLENITQFINIVDDNGDTLLHRVFIKNPVNIDIIKTLLEAGADINEQNKDGDTILHIAIRNFNNNPNEEHLNIIRFILDPESTDADIDLLNKDYESPHNMNAELINAIVAEQHEIKHDKAIKAYKAHKKSKETRNYEI